MMCPTRFAAPRAATVVIVALLAIAVGLTTTAASPQAVAQARLMAQHAATAHSYHRSAVQHAELVSATTLRARLLGRTPGFPSATARHPNRHISGTWYGQVSILPVLKRQGDRLKVRLPRRPNESTTWVRRARVQLLRTHYAIVIDLSQRRLYWYQRGEPQGSYPIGVGKPSTPTPTGHFFLAFHAIPPPGEDYGPQVLETSAHSNVFQTFGAGTHDAIIAIHGPIFTDRQIGRNGTAISHGCIRMHTSQLRQILFLPKGTPIVITH